MSMSAIPLLYDEENAKPLFDGGPLNKILDAGGRALGGDIYTLLYHDVLSAVLTEEELEDLEHDPVYKSGSPGEYILESEKFPQEFKDFIRPDVERDPESDGFEYALV